MNTTNVLGPGARVPTPVKKGAAEKIYVPCPPFFFWERSGGNPYPGQLSTRLCFFFFMEFDALIMT